jgi:hypothetical protein
MWKARFEANVTYKNQLSVHLIDERAFAKIHQSIIFSLWHLTSPRLFPPNPYPPSWQLCWFSEVILKTGLSSFLMFLTWIERLACSQQTKRNGAEICHQTSAQVRWQVLDRFPYTNSTERKNVTSCRFLLLKKAMQWERKP